MQKYYWSIRILAIVHIAAPIVNMLFSAHLSDMSLTHYLSVSWQNSPLLDLVILYLVPPLAGIALWQQNKNSYYIYMVLFALMSLRNFYEFTNLSYRYSWQLILFSFGLNISALAYLLSANVRSIFLNTFTAKDFKLNELQIYPSCKITNINDSMYIQGSKLEAIKAGDQISFKLKDLDFTDTVNQVKPSPNGVELSFNKPL